MGFSEGATIYIGQIKHRDKVYHGQHPAIIEQSVWDEVQAKLNENRQGHRQRIHAESLSLLAGLVWDDQGDRLTPSHSKKGERRNLKTEKFDVAEGPRTAWVYVIKYLLIK
ncbi:MAG: hypothetical protein G3I10_10670 [Ferrovum sp.]|nr:hypothetical protein [Ferrovum sp.]